MELIIQTIVLTQVQILNHETTWCYISSWKFCSAHQVFRYHYTRAKIFDGKSRENRVHVLSELFFINSRIFLSSISMKNFFLASLSSLTRSQFIFHLILSLMSSGISSCYLFWFDSLVRSSNFIMFVIIIIIMVIKIFKD